MTKRIRILSLISNLHFGGDENRLLAFAQTLDRRRFDHLIVTTSQADAEVDRRYGGMRQQYADAGVEVISLDEQPPDRPPLRLKAMQLARTGVTSLSAVRRLSRLIRRLKIDLVSIHLNTANPVGVLAGMTATLGLR